MRNRRRNWLLRRVVLGFAVAAIAAPAAQARLYEGGGTSQSDGNGVLIQGDDKVFAPAGETHGLVIKGDDKVFAPESDGVLIQGDDKVFAPAGETHGLVIKGDDKVFAPVPGSDLVYLKGDDKVILTPSDWQYSQFAYRHAMPQDYRGVATQVSDEAGKPAGRQVPVASIGVQDDFNWADGLIGAVVALGLAALAYGVARSTRETRRTVTG
jgi:hypothetical protein